MRIVFDESTLRQGQNASRSITGVLYVDVSGFLFPAEQWNDFVVVVAQWWLSELDRIGNGAATDGVLRFMDGPYHLGILAQGGDVMLLRCIENRRDSRVVCEATMNLSDLSEQVVRFAKDVASACQRAQLDTSDVQALRKLLQAAGERD